MTPIEEPQEIELPRGLVAEASAPLPVIQHPDGSTEPAPASSVYAKDIIGLLTSEQIEELEAAKISGQLTPEQIEAINAAQIIGEIVNAQIKGIGANKLEGFVEGTQIAAETITGGNIKALTVTTGKIAAESITTEKIAALNVTTAKLAANAITAEKISAGAITTTKLAASAVTAAKINVATLSAISVNAGTITAGTFKGVTFETEEEGTTFDNEGITLFGVETNSPIHRRKIEWRNKAASATLSELWTTMVNFAPEVVTNFATKGITGKEAALVEISAQGTAGELAELFLFSNKTGSENYVGARAGGKFVKIFEKGQKSNFVQLPFSEKAVLVSGVVSALGVKLAGENFTSKKTGAGNYTIEYTLEFSSSPRVIAVVMGGGFATAIELIESTKSKTKLLTFRSSTLEVIDAEFHFIAIG